jgi:hypothetical protein
VAHHVAMLEQLESRRCHDQPQQQQQQKLEAAQATEASLQAIGEHIDRLDAPLLWNFVAAATEHRMSGRELERLYRGIALTLDGSQAAPGEYLGLC